MSVEIGLLIALLMLLGNAFFVGAEFGLISARRSNIELEALNGSRSAKLTLAAMEQVSLMLAGAQLGVTVCSLILGAVSEPIIAHLLEGPFHAAGLTEELLHPVSLIVALAITVYLHVVIGEMVPKNLALAAPTRTALLLTPPLLLFVKLTRPVVAALNAVANSCLKLVGITAKDEISSSFSRDEVAGFVKESHREGLLSRDEEQLLSGALSFGERTIRSVLLPLEEIVSVGSEVTTAEVEALSSKTGFSRFPVKSGQGKLTGYFHLKDMLGIEDDDRHASVPRKYIRPLVTLQSDTSLREALVSMQRSGAHLARVAAADQQNVVVGIVALEDVLEELVGVIRDDAHKAVSTAT
jgi:CBS domain containing-hemolysin-like protein